MWADDPMVHSDPKCRRFADSGPEPQGLIRFDADIAARACFCCRLILPDAATDDLTDAVAALLALCDLLDEEDEETFNREEPDYVPDFEAPNFSQDHWRHSQSTLADATSRTRHHPWLHRWASPLLLRTASHVERRCEEQRNRLDPAAVEAAAITMQQRPQSPAQLKRAWLYWRHRQDWRAPSPDDAHYGRDAHPPAQNPTPEEAMHGSATVVLGLRIPPLALDWDSMPNVDSLSAWEKAAVVAYKSTADWAAGSVTLAAPPAVAQELLSPARGLTVTISVSAGEQTP
jgi:hypothetical protein